MHSSGTYFQSLLAICFLITVVGCQSAGARQTAAISPSLGNVRTVKAESTSSDQRPIVLLSQELQTAENLMDVEPSDRSLWSKLRTPTRFLLPRTDADSNSAPVLEPEQGLNDGF